jgi:transposase
VHVSAQRLSRYVRAESSGSSTDAEWDRLEPLLPDRTPARGGRWSDHRQVINGLFWRTRTGAPWRDLPTSYGNWKTVYSRHRRWSGDGAWVKILDRPRAGCDVDKGSQWTVGADSPAVAESTADTGAGSNHKSSTPARPKRADREALGRSRSGLTTKIHLLSDSRCRPLARVTTAGQRHDSAAFEPLMDRLRIRRPGRGRPRTRPRRLLADEAYSNRTIRSRLRRWRIKTTIPEKSDQQRARPAKGSAGGRPPKFDTTSYQ